jgi:exonuclease VII large subunit
MNPDNVLKRGYSITLINGKVLKKVDEVVEGDVNKILKELESAEGLDTD